MKNNKIINNAKKIVVVGGGNTAIDCDRLAIRDKGTIVTNIYRRSENEMPANLKEFICAKNEGVEFEFLTNPIEIVKDESNHIKEIKCIKMELGKPGEDGRRQPIEVKGSEFILECDLLILALGATENSDINLFAPDIIRDQKGCVIINELSETNRNKIFAGGDLTRGPSTVANAISDGINAAKRIEFLYK